MRHRSVLPLAALVALASVSLTALSGCSDEKKGEPKEMTKPAPATDPTKPDATNPGTTKPAEPRQ